MKNQPPKLADKFLKWFCNPELIEPLLGDLHEYYERLEAKKITSSLKYWLQVLNIFRPFAFRRLLPLNKTGFSLTKLNLVLALRNLRRHKFYSIINCVGLAIGISSALLISLYVLDELNVDTHWKDGDRIYRATTEISYGETQTNTAYATAPIADLFEREFPEVEVACRWVASPDITFLIDGQPIKERNILFADQDFFSIFSVNVLHGNITNALTEPNTMVLTKRSAIKLFSKTDAVGETLESNDGTSFNVTCVIDDIPENSHFTASAFRTTINDFWSDPSQHSLVTYWTGSAYRTFVKLKKGTDPLEMEAKFDKVFAPYLDPVMKEFAGQSYQELIAEGNTYRYHLQPLENIYLYSDFDFTPKQGDIKYVYMFSAIGVFILILAYINFINLSTARAAERLKEISVKKIMGSTRKQLTLQFLSEAVLISFISLLLASALVYLLLPTFNQLAGKNFADPLFNEYQMWSIAIIGTLGVGILAGIYPALILSKQSPSDVLKTKSKSSRVDSLLRNGLIVFQFSISLILIIGTIVIYKQLHYSQNKDLGYTRDGVLIVNQLSAVGSHLESFKEDLLAHAEIEKVSVVNSIPSDPFFSRTFLHKTDNMTRDGKVNIERLWVDENMISTFEIPLIMGRNFYKDQRKDTASVIISKLTAERLGLKNPIGTKLKSSHDTRRNYTVIGVIDDFHVQSLKSKLMPTALFRNVTSRRLAIRYSTHDLIQLHNQIETSWNKFAPQEILFTEFLDSRYEAFYSSEKTLASIFNIFVVIALFIASIGLLGLASLMTESRKKEVGVRKVLGASPSQLIVLLNVDLIKPILLSIFIGLPIGFVLMESWLNQFAFRISIEWIVMAYSALICLIMGWLVVTILTYRASQLNPVENLKYE